MYAEVSLCTCVNERLWIQIMSNNSTTVMPPTAVHVVHVSSYTFFCRLARVCRLGMLENKRAGISSTDLCERALSSDPRHKTQVQPGTRASDVTARDAFYTATTTRMLSSHIQIFDVLEQPFKLVQDTCIK